MPKILYTVSTDSIFKSRVHETIDVNEPERESDGFEDGVCKKKESSLLKFTRYACTKSIAD